MHGLAVYPSRVLLFLSRFSFVARGFSGVRLTFSVKGAPIRQSVGVSPPVPKDDHIVQVEFLTL